MRRSLIAFAASVALGLCGAGTGLASDAHAQAGVSGATDLSAQQARVRVRPRIEIHPARRLVRDCVSWLEQEARPSGTVIVPKMRCWWRAG
jgi:hypothetical protein